MPAKDLGTKHVCFKCGTKFYDLRKPEPICPKCGADQRESPALKSPSSEKRSRAPRPAPAPAPAREPAEEIEADGELLEDDDDAAEDEAGDDDDA